MTSDERLRHLLMAALDGELEDAEMAELERRLEADAELRAEWRRQRKLKELTMMSTISDPPREQWDTYWRSIYNRIERGIGWILVSVGAIALLTFGLWSALTELLADTGTPGVVKMGLLALGTGTIVLLVSVIREKLFVRRHDPYKEVER
jgi:anti-sigma factor RsiW